MFSLRKKLNKLKKDIVQNSSCADDCIETIDNILKKLDEYNIVAVPKTFRLSLIIQRLEKELM